MIAAAIAVLGFAGDLPAQNDAAEKAMEGGIDHWIEYYKGEQRKAAATLPQGTVTPVDQATPVVSTASGVPPREKTERK